MNSQILIEAFQAVVTILYSVLFTCFYFICEDVPLGLSYTLSGDPKEVYSDLVMASASVKVQNNNNHLQTLK